MKRKKEDRYRMKMGQKRNEQKREKDVGKMNQDRLSTFNVPATLLSTADLLTPFILTKPPTLDVTAYNLEEIETEKRLSNLFIQCRTGAVGIYSLHCLRQRSPNFLASGTGFMEDNFSMDWGGGGRGWFWDDSSTLHLLCTLFLLLLHCNI